MSFADDLQCSRDGDVSAQEKLFNPIRPRLWLLARKVLGSRLSVRVPPSDVVAHSLQRASSKLAAFQGQSQEELEAWLKAIVVRRARKVHQHHHRLKRDVDREGPLPDFDLRGRAADPVDSVIDREQQDLLARAIAELPEREKEVVLRRLIDRQRLADVAQELEVSTRTIKRCLTSALCHLKEWLELRGQGR